MENIEQLIQQANDKDFANANNTFVDIMNQKLADTLEQEKIKVAGQIYNGEESDDEEQLELDLEDDAEELVADDAEAEADADESEEDEDDVDDEPDTDESDEDPEES